MEKRQALERMLTSAREFFRSRHDEFLGKLLGGEEDNDVSLPASLVAEIKDTERVYMVGNNDLLTAFESLGRRDLETQRSAIYFLNQFLDKEGYFFYRRDMQAPLIVGRKVKEYKIPQEPGHFVRVVDLFNSDDILFEEYGATIKFGDKVLDPYIFRREMVYTLVAFVQECNKGQNFNPQNRDYLTRLDLDFSSDYYGFSCDKDKGCSYRELVPPSGQDRVNRRLSLILRELDEGGIRDLYDLAMQADEPYFILRNVIFTNICYRLGRQYGDFSHDSNRKFENDMEIVAIDHEVHHFRERKLNLFIKKDAEYTAGLATMAFSPLKEYTLAKQLAEHFFDKINDTFTSKDDIKSRAKIVERFVVESTGGSVKSATSGEDDLKKLRLITIGEDQIADISQSLLRMHYGKPYEELFGKYQPINVK